MPKKTNKQIIYTIGHSDRSIGDFLELLRAHGIEKVVDIRTIPKSRYNPQLNEERLRGALKKEKMAICASKRSAACAPC